MTGMRSRYGRTGVITSRERFVWAWSDTADRKVDGIAGSSISTNVVIVW
jgi:hypothetical protein